MKQLKKLACRTVLDLRMTFPPKTVLSIILGTAITTFGIYNVHRQADITEGGILGLILLFNFWIGMSSSILSPVLDALSYALGFKYLGREFLKTSIFATICMAGFFRLWEMFPPLLPSLAGRLQPPWWEDASSGQAAALWCARALPAQAMMPWPWSFPRLQAAVFPGPICLRMLRYLFYPCPTSLHSALCIHSVSSFLIDFIQNHGLDKDDDEDGGECSTVT